MLIFPSFFFRKGKKRLSRDELEGHLELHVIRSLEERIAPSVEYKNDCWNQSFWTNFFVYGSSPFVLLNLHHLETQFNPFDEIPIWSLLSNSTLTSSNFRVKHQPCAAQFASFGNSIQPIWWNSNTIIVIQFHLNFIKLYSKTSTSIVANFCLKKMKKRIQ